MTQYEYTAFISYSHAADGALAEVLQSQLQRFATPWYKRRSIRVFRDKTGLSVTPDLWESIHAALTHSEFFLLLASERAAQSPWVEREVDTWLDSGAADRLLIVWTDGELAWDNASGDFDWSRTTCLPARLRGALKAEPLFLDMRWARSREDLSARRPEFLDALARLSSAVRRQPLDDLIGEDVRQHRRVRRLATGAVAALSMLAIGMLIAATVALQQRNEARLQQQEAQAQRAVAEQRLVQSLVGNGLRLLDERDLSGAALWFADAMQLDTGQGKNNQRLRAQSSLAQHPRLQQLWSLPDAARHWLAFSRDGRFLLTQSLTEDSAPLSSRLWDIGTGTEVVVKVPSAQHRVLAIDAGAEGVRVVVADREGGVSVHNGSTGEELARLPHPAVVTSAEFAASGQRLVTVADDDVARVWEAGSWRLLKSVAHDNTLSAAALSADNKYLLSFTNDGAAHIWSLGAQPRSHIRLEHEDSVQSIDIAADARRAVTLDGAWTARVWDIGAEPASLLEARDGVDHTEFSPDGTRVVMAFRGGEVTVFDALDMREQVNAGHDGAVLAARFSADGKRIASAGTDRIARLWNARSGKPLSPPLYHEDTVSNLALSADALRLATVTAAGTVRVWELAATRTNYAHEGIDHAEYSADGASLLTVSERMVKMWNTKTGTALTLHDGAQVHQAAFSPDGRHVVIGSEDGSAQIRDARTGVAFVNLAHGRRVSLVAFAEDGRRIATAGRREDGGYGIAIWDLTHAARLFDLEHDSPVTQMEFSHDGRRLLARYFDGALRVWDLEKRLAISALSHEECRSATISRDGSYLAVFHDSGTVSIHDANTGSERLSGLHVDDYRLRQVAIAPDSQSLLIVSDAVTRVFDVITGAPRTPVIRHQTAGLLRASFSHDGKRLVTVGFDGNARVWDTHSGLPLTPLLAHPGEAKDAAFSADGERLVTAGGDEARLWELGDRVMAESDEQLGLRARLVAARRIDETGTVVPLGKKEMQDVWKALHK